MKTSKSIFIAFKDALDAFITRHEAASSMDKADISVHISQFDDDWNKNALEVANKCQSDNIFERIRMRCRDNNSNETDSLNRIERNNAWNKLAYDLVRKEAKTNK